MLEKQQVGDILTKLLKKANYSWWNECFLSPEYTNDYLCFVVADTKYAYGRLARSKKTLQKLLTSIFNAKALEGLNDCVFIGGLVYHKDGRSGNVWQELMGA